MAYAKRATYLTVVDLEFAAGKDRGYDLVDAEVIADKILTAIQEFEAISK